MGNRRAPYKKRQRIDGIIVDGQQDLKPRRCLGHCGEMFHPSHRGNFVCPTCTAYNEELNDKEYKVGVRIRNE